MQKILQLTALTLSAIAILQAADATVAADTFISTQLPGNNFGSLGNLNAGAGNTTLIRFDLSTVPAGVGIRRATLKLYVNKVNATGLVDIYAAGSPWTELAATGSNAPLLAGGLIQNGVPAPAVGQWLTVDVTQTVQSWRQGTRANDGIVISSATGSFAFDSKENTSTSHAPQLEIILEGTAGRDRRTGSDRSNRIAWHAGTDRSDRTRRSHKSRLGHKQLHGQRR